MSNRVIVTTVTSGSFEHFIPIFLYTLRKNVPHVYTKVFHRGHIDDITREGMDTIRASGITVDMPIEDVFTDYPHHAYTTNCLRFLIPESYFPDTEHVYITDVDFIFFQHQPDIASYYSAKQLLWEECYWGRRGPKRNKKTEEVTKRIAGGGFLATPQWFGQTADMRAKMREKVMNGDLGQIREDDERMLWDICAGSGLKCPTKGGNSRKAKYKEIHLGDFKADFKRWTRLGRMKKRIPRGNFYKAFRLEEDPVWNKLTACCCKDPMVKEVMDNYWEYLKRRKESGRNTSGVAT
jgi:hypothetical protein